MVLAAPLLAFGVRAQRAEAGPPGTDPFGHPVAPEVPGGWYKSHTYQNGILTIRATDGSTRQVQPWAEGVVKISYFGPGRRPVADSSVSVVQPPAAYDPQATATLLPLDDAKHYGFAYPYLSTARFLPPMVVTRAKAVRTTATSVQLLTEHQLITINKHTLAVNWQDFYDAAFFGEAAPAYRRRPTTSPAPNTPPGRLDELASLGVRFRLQPGERLYGTGARALPLDRRGHRLELYNQAHYGYQNGEPNLNVALPVVLSSRGYLLLFDDHAAGYLDLGKKNSDVLEYGLENACSHSYIGELCNDKLSYFVVTGRNQAEILDRYTALTGRQPLPPRWALGLIQSRFGYRSQAEMRAVADRMRRENFPLDALVLDLYWFGGTTRQGDFTWDTTHFPDPTGIMRDLKAQGVNTILISEPYVMRTSRNDSLVRTLGLVGTTARRQPYTVGSFWAGPASILDVFKPETRAWLWAQYSRLHDQGAAGWWSDLGEPENHPDAMYHRFGRGRLPARQVHNAYGLAWAKIFQDNYAKTYPDERLFNLARSGWAGMQHHSVFPWSGDVSRTWSGLQAQVPIMLGMGQAGVGYMHSDAGGFGANATQDPELYTRWLQMAAFGPILRPHSDQVVAPEPYTYPEPYKSIVRHYTHLRAELLPYLYTLAAENTLTGAPLVRALDFTGHPSVGAWNSSSYPYAIFDKNTATDVPTAPLLNSQFLLGSSLLVAPVSGPGQRRRNVFLPATPGGWVDFETSQTLPSGQIVGLPAPLGHIPLLVRAGAFVPLTAYRASAAHYRPDTLAVRYFPRLVPEENQSSFTLYEDDGHSAQALAHEQYATIQFFGVCSAAGSRGRQVVISAQKAGAYAGEPAERLVLLRIARVAAAPASIQLNNQLLAASAWRFDSTQRELRIQFRLGEQAEITISGLHLLAQPATQLDPETLTLTAPDSRTFTDEATISYLRHGIVGQPETLRIRDQRGQLVREFPTLATPGPQTLHWDGRDAQGHPVPAGLYVAEAAGQHQVLRRLP